MATQRRTELRKCLMQAEMRTHLCSLPFIDLVLLCIVPQLLRDLHPAKAMLMHRSALSQWSLLLLTPGRSELCKALLSSSGLSPSTQCRCIPKGSHGALLMPAEGKTVAHLHGAELGATHGAEVSRLGRLLRQGGIMEQPGRHWVQRQVELVIPAKAMLWAAGMWQS